MAHKPEEIIEALLEEMNGIIEDEILMAALKLEPQGSKLEREDVKRYCRTGQRTHNGKAVADYYWREHCILTIYEPDIHPSGRGIVFAFRRRLENDRLLQPKLFYRDPDKLPIPPEPKPEVDPDEVAFNAKEGPLKLVNSKKL